MRVLLVQKDFFPHYGVLCLASAVRKAGHTCDFIITDMGDFSETLTGFRPDVVALTFTSGQLPWAKETARLTRNLLGKEIPILVGGFHPTFFPEIVLEGWCDIATRGEADLSFPLLLKALEEGTPLEKVPNLAFSKGGSLHLTAVELPSCLDALPFPSYDLLVKYDIPKRLGYIIVRSSRGCSYDCKFCYTNAIRALLGFGRQALYRRQSPPRVIAQIRYALCLFPSVGFVKFEDDTFTMPPDSWLKDFALHYKQEIALPFHCQSRIDLINSYNAALLKDAGCTAVRFGVESADDTIRNITYGKALSESAICSGVETLKRHGLVCIAYNMVDAQSDRIEQALDTYRFNLSLGVDCANCVNLHVYPGSVLAGDGRELNYKSEYFYFCPQGGATREFENLSCLFPCAIALRIPAPILSMLIHAPRNPLYRLLLWIGQGLIKMKMGEHRFTNLIRLHVFARKFFSSSS